MAHGSSTLRMAQAQRQRQRVGRVSGAATLSTLLALGLARAWRWSVLTGIVLGGILGAVVLVGMLVGVGGFIVWVLTHAGKARPSWLHLARINAPAEEVVFPDGQREHLVHGLSFPLSTSAPTILVSSGFRRDLMDVLKTSVFLWWAGYHVLAFEYHGHGPRSAGVPVSLGYLECTDFLGAVTYARQRDCTTRMGAVGYSMGAAVTIVGAAWCQEIEAVVADSAFASVWSAVEVNMQRIFHLSRHLPAWILHLLFLVTDALLWWRAGFHIDTFEPARDIAKIAPRPLLLIHGTADPIVSPDDAATLYRLAGEGRALWLIPDAHHTTGQLVEHTAYEERLCAFFASAFALPAKGKRTPRALPNRLPEDEMN